MSTRVRLSVMMFLQYFIWGCVVRHDGDVPRADAAVQRIDRSGWPTARRRSPRIVSPFFVGMVADRFFATEKMLAVLHLLGGVLLLYVSTLDGVRPVLPRPDRVHALLHADAGADELDFVPPHAGPGAGVPAHPCARHDRLDRGRLRHRPSRAREDRRHVPMRVAAGASIAARALLPRAAAHAARQAAAHAITVRDVLGLDALQLMKERSFAIFVVGVVSALHPAAVLLRVHESVPERDRRGQPGEQDDVRPDVRDRLHAASCRCSSCGSASSGCCSSACSPGRCGTCCSRSATPARSCGCCTSASCCTASVTTSSS